MQKVKLQNSQKSKIFTFQPLQNLAFQPLKLKFHNYKTFLSCDYKILIHTKIKLFFE